MRLLIFFDVGWNALLWGSEVFSSWEVTCNKIQYNTLFWQHFSWSRWRRNSHAQLYKFIFMYIGQTIVCVTDWWYGLIILWFGWSSVRQWFTFDVFIFLNISQPGWMKLDPGSSKLVPSSLGVQVNPCEKCSGVKHGKTSPDYQPMM